MDAAVQRRRAKREQQRQETWGEVFTDEHASESERTRERAVRPDRTLDVESRDERRRSVWGRERQESVR